MEQWYPEVNHFCRRIPIILVACKKDLRNDPKTLDELRKTSQHPISQGEVRKPFRSLVQLEPNSDLVAGSGYRSQDRREAIRRVLCSYTRRRSRSLSSGNPCCTHPPLTSGTRSLRHPVMYFDLVHPVRLYVSWVLPLDRPIEAIRTLVARNANVHM